MSSSELCMVVFLGINTWTDIRKREICLPVFLGDGLMIFAMGSVLNAGELMEILCLSFLLCGIYAGLQLGLLKKKRNTEIPFVPFLLVGYLGGILT